jgi:predicted DCC family thiol-disulfide oxidoreductase YuxK
MARAVLIYDGRCHFCRRGIAWISRRVIQGQLEFLPCQAIERRIRYPAMEDRVCLEAMQLVLPDGRVLAGAAAVPEILRRLSRWRWLAAAFRLPGMSIVALCAYGWIARHRHQISSLMGRHHDRSG